MAPNARSPVKDVTDTEQLKAKQNILDTVEKLRAGPITDQRRIRDRLLVTLGPVTRIRVSSTRWRRDSARKGYRTILKASHHLLVPFIISIPPSVCATLTTNGSIEALADDEDLLSTKLQLGDDARELLDSIAEDGGFTDDQIYTGLIHSLFPEGLPIWDPSFDRNNCG
jgi:hypothetical protein